MKKILEILIVSVNYVIITYALSNMALLFNASLLYILFFASEVWAFSCYLNYIHKQTKSKGLAYILAALCFIIHIAMVYFIGRISGTMVPFH